VNPKMEGTRDSIRPAEELSSLEVQYYIACTGRIWCGWTGFSARADGLKFVDLYVEVCIH